MIDLATLMIVGRQIADPMRTLLVTDGLGMGRPLLHLQQDAMIDNDQTTQYACGNCATYYARIVAMVLKGRN